MWNNPELDKPIKNLCNHKMVCCYHFPSCQELYGTSKNYPGVESNPNKNIKYEGIYIFGGRSDPGIVNNDLFVINTNVKPWRLTEPETLGYKPIGRWGHSMFFVREQNFVIIYGGRNNALFATTGIFYF